MTPEEFLKSEGYIDKTLFPFSSVVNILYRYEHTLKLEKECPQPEDLEKAFISANDVIDAVIKLRNIKGIRL